MPASIPSPPPQPSLSETRAGVALLRRLVAVALLLFLAYSLSYGPRGFMVEYGREQAPSWMLWKRDNLDESALRAHPGGHIVWLVGSSILRESFDEDEINQALSESGSHYRVQKFGMSRGAAGLAWGVLRRLPVAPGDIVIHSVSMDNFHKNWLEFSDIPDDWLMLLSTRTEIATMPELPIQRRVELILSFPWSFWAWQDEAQTGWWAWLQAPFFGAPKPETSSRLLTYQDREIHPQLETARALGEDSRNFIKPEDVDYGPDQINVAGLARFRAFCAEHQARLILLDIPPRREYFRDFLAPEVAAGWSRWKAAQPEILYFPQLPDEDYYDLRHPNFRGRALQNQTLIDWLTRTDVGGDAP